jgi:hypothetical protein
MEAVGHAGTCLGILAKDGIVLCAEKKNQHKLLGKLFPHFKLNSAQVHNDFLKTYAYKIIKFFC